MVKSVWFRSTEQMLFEPQIPDYLYFCAYPTGTGNEIPRPNMTLRVGLAMLSTRISVQFPIISAIHSLNHRPRSSAPSFPWSSGPP